MRRGLIGLILLAVVAVVAVVLTQTNLGQVLQRGAALAPVKVAIYYGGEKQALLAEPAVQKILTDRYAITLDATKAGSVEMVTRLDTSAKDCLWPSNELAVELAKESGKSVLAEDTIFNSPIVLYAWADVAAALQKAGVVTDRNGILVADTARLGGLIHDGKRWKQDLGLDLYGPFRVISTDPAKSNSGNIWAALLATALNNGQAPTEADALRLAPEVAAYFASLGFMESSSGDLFANFLKQGMGARPLIVGYENQLVEFVVANQNYAQLIRDKIKVIYPEPTIFASHPLISLTPICKRLVTALTDPELQKLAWTQHGFRTGLIGIDNKPSDVAAITLPETVQQVVPMPSAATMRALVALQ